MAAKDLDTCDVKKQEELEDITTCCICTETYIDPKALPCIHTFCMKCLQENGLKTNKGPGDEMPCPICRRLFKIPPEGFHELPKHFFIERLIQVSTVLDPSSATKALCSVCLEESKEQGGDNTPTADSYCVDCKHKLCEECLNEHKTFKITKNHTLIPINEYESGQNALADLAPMVCNVHEQRFLDVYCADCKTVVCAMCFIEIHNNHKGCDVNKCVDDFRKQIQNNIEALNECTSHSWVKKTELMKAKEEIQKLAASIECDIVKRKDEIKHITDIQTSLLRQSLCSKTHSRLKEIQIASDDIDAYISNLESYNSYCQRIVAKGSPSDICSALSGLAVRAFELQQQCQPIIERGMQEFKLHFRQSELEELLDGYHFNLIGEIHNEGGSMPKKSSKADMLSAQSKELEILKNRNEQLRKEGANYNAQIEKLKQELDNNKIAISALQNSNDRDKNDYIATIEKLKQELGNHETAINELQVSKDKLKQKLRKEKTARNSLQINIDKLLEELNTYKAKFRKVQVELRYRSNPVFVQAIRRKASVELMTSIRGLTILDKELFVVSQLSSEVEVYDMIKLIFTRRWNLEEQTDPQDIASCDRNKCLYILQKSDAFLDSMKILRVDRNGQSIKTWATPNSSGNLSITDESNVLLTVRYESKLNEYSPDGQLLLEIQAGIPWPWHAIKLTSGHFVVCHGHGDLHRVCIVDADGKVQKSFGGTRGSTIGEMNEPFYLSIDVNGFVMVVDRRNNRVLLLDSDLKFRREIISKEDRHGLRDPWRIVLDESHGRLFVADNESREGRIFAFDLIIM